MDINKFIEERPEWAQEPCVYIVKQMFEGNNAYRCGASGTKQYTQSDRVFGAERATYTGLLARMVMYTGYWLPLKGHLYAALRVEKKLVANPDLHRMGTDATGASYNITRGNFTLVLQREAEFHQELDRRKLRWQKDKRNELFTPGAKGVEELISALRTIQGIELYLFNETSYFLDTSYRGGKERRGAPVITETVARQLPPREKKDVAPSIYLKLNEAEVQRLRESRPANFALLKELVEKVTPAPAVFTATKRVADLLAAGDVPTRRAVAQLQQLTPKPPAPKPPTPQTVTMTRAQTRALREGNTAILDAVRQVRRSPRLNP